MRATALSTGAVVASATLIGAAPVPRPSLPDVVPVVQAHDVALTAFDETGFITSLELALVNIVRELTRLTGLSGDSAAGFITFGLGDLTPNQLLSATGLGDLKLSDLLSFANLFGLGANPVSVLEAATGVNSAMTLPELATHLGIGNQPLSDFYNLIGISNYQDATLGDLATSLGLAGGPVSNLYGLLGLNADSTLSDTVNALGIGDTKVDTLLDDWGVGSDHINTFLQGLSVSPQELLQILDVNPDDISSIYDPTTGEFVSGTTVQDFADATPFGDDTVDQLLSTNDIGGATLNEGLTGIGLQPDATVSDVLNTIGFKNLEIGDFLSGFGLQYGSGYTNTVDDLFNAIPGFHNGTLGDLLGALGLSDQSTINDVFSTVPGLGGNTLSDLITDLGWGDEKLSDISSSLLGDTTVDQYLTDIMSALVTA
jgi:hypothetical protein